MSRQQDSKTRDLIKQIKALVDSIPDIPEDDLSSLTARSRSSLRMELLKISETMENFAGDLDPIQLPDEVFDPSDPVSIGKLIAKTLLERTRISMVDIHRFYGSGVYAIYYIGDFDPYSAISNSDMPVYVGKVDPKIPNASTPQEQGDKLWHRLVKDHAKNIDKAKNLEISDFECRYLVVKSAWQNTAETYLIDRFQPVWNSEVKICYGFGKHGDSSKTRDNTRSPWDTLHPGREWAADAKPHEKTARDLVREIKAHYAQSDIS